MGSEASFIGQYSRLFFGAACIPAIVIDCVTIITILVLWIVKRRRRMQKDKESSKLLPWKEDEDNEEVEALEKVDGSNRKKITEKHLADKDGSTVLIYAAIWMGVFSIAWLLIFLCIWRVWPVGAAVPVTTLFLWAAWALLLPLPDKKLLHGPWNSPMRVFVGIGSKMRGRPYSFFGGWICLFLAVFIPAFFGYGICVSFDPINISSAYSRSRQVQYCEKPGICHNYLTLPQNPSRGVIFNLHTHEVASAGNEIRVYFDTVSRNGSSLSSYSQSVVGKSWEEVNCDGLIRGIHWIDVDSLQPETTYYFRVGLGQDEKLYSTEKKFRTLSEDTSKIKFITGGDLGISEMTRTMMKLSAAQSPDFALIGGDIAYANAMSTCYRMWDTYLDWWENVMVTPDGYSIPQILAIGNHEAGGFGTLVKDIPHFLAWFPQQLGVAREDRSTYHSHFVGNDGVILALDSAISSMSEGNNQADWMEKEFSTTFQNCSKRFAVYHVPLFPSYRTMESFPTAELRQIWVPVFDKHNLTIGFENHDHAYKRTVPLRNNVMTPGGTVYVGDGAWGVPVRSSLAATAGRYYIDYSVSKNFVVSVSLGRNSVNITSIDENNKVFDSFVKVTQ